MTSMIDMTGFASDTCSLAKRIASGCSSLSGLWTKYELSWGYDAAHSIHAEAILPICSCNSIGITNQWFVAFTNTKHSSLVANCSSYLDNFVLRNAVYFLEGRLDWSLDQVIWNKAYSSHRSDLIMQKFGAIILPLGLSTPASAADYLCGNFEVAFEFYRSNIALEEFDVTGWRAQLLASLVESNFSNRDAIEFHFPTNGRNAFLTYAPNARPSDCHISQPIHYRNINIYHLHQVLLLPSHYCVKRTSSNHKFVLLNLLIR